MSDETWEHLLKIVIGVWTLWAILQIVDFFVETGWDSDLPDCSGGWEKVCIEYDKILVEVEGDLIMNSTYVVGVDFDKKTRFFEYVSDYDKCIQLALRCIP